MVRGLTLGLEILEAAVTRSRAGEGGVGMAWLSLKDLEEPSFSPQAICHGRQRLGALYRSQGGI